MRAFRWLSLLPFRLGSLPRLRGLDAELEEELRYHVDRQTEQLIASGHDHVEARRAALLAIGGVEQTKERCRDATGMRYLLDGWHDLQYGARVLWRSRAFSATAVAMIGLGLGVNAAVFSVFYSLLLKPLPYREAEQLVLVWQQYVKQNLDRVPMSAVEVQELRTAVAAFSDVATFRYTEFNLTHGGKPERVHAALVSPNLFDTLGVSPSRGRTFNEQDATAPPSAVVISENLWRRRFGSDSDIIGRQVTFSGRLRTIVGVMPAAFEFPLRLFNTRGPAPARTEIWIASNAPNTAERSVRAYGVVARLRHGATIEQANEELARLANGWVEQHPGAYHGKGFEMDAGLVRDQVLGPLRPALWIVVVAAGVVLLICVTNAIAMLLARLTSREQELATRVALGAGSLRLFRQLFTEGLMLAFAAGFFALPLSLALIKAARDSGARTIPLLETMSLGGRVVLLDALLTFATGVLLGAVPAIRAATRARQTTALGIVLAPGVLWQRIRDGLLVAQTALALVLLLGAALLIKGHLQLMREDPGFDVTGVMTAEISLPFTKYQAEAAVAGFFSAAKARLQSELGTRAVGFTSVLPLSGANSDRSFTAEGLTLPPDGQTPDEEMRVITPGYFETLGVATLQGQSFNEADTADSLPVAIINQALARRYWPGDDALGKRIILNDQIETARWRRIIGIVRDVRHRGLDEDARPELYLPHAQMPVRLMVMVAKTADSPAATEAAIRAAVASIDPEQAVSIIRPLREVVAASVAPRRLVVIAVSFFACVSAAVATAGAYGVMSYLFTARRREIALRIAFGAQSRDIVVAGMVRSVWLLALATALGLATAFCAIRALDRLRYDVAPSDLPTLLGVVVLFAGAVVLATFIPARQAARASAAPVLRGG